MVNYDEGYILCETDLVVSITSLFYNMYFRRMFYLVIIPYMIYFISVCLFMSLYLIERGS